MAVVVLNRIEHTFHITDSKLIQFFTKIRVEMVATKLLDIYDRYQIDEKKKQ